MLYMTFIYSFVAYNVYFISYFEYIYLLWLSQKNLLMLRVWKVNCFSVLTVYLCSRLQVHVKVQRASEAGERHEQSLY